MLFIHDLTTYSKDKIYLAVMVFFPAVIAYIASDIMPGMAFMMFMISVATSILAPFYLASHICANMRTKQDSIAFAMMPATNVEKFIVRFVDYAILPSLIVFVCMLAIALFIGCLFSIGHYDELKSFIATIGTFINEDLFNIDWDWVFSFETFTGLVMILTCGFYDMALVVLGGCFFKRFALVKTWLIVMAISVTLGGFVHVTGIIDFIVESTGAMWCGIGVMTLINIAIIYLSYMLFKRKQII